MTDLCRNNDNDIPTLEDLEREVALSSRRHPIPDLTGLQNDPRARARNLENIWVRLGKLSSAIGPVIVIAVCLSLSIGSLVAAILSGVFYLLATVLIMFGLIATATFQVSLIARLFVIM